jgi:ubiquinone/menaquinone biosynthesis C-methylase UbiE
MDLLTSLSREADYSKFQLQFILGAWVASSLVEKKQKISTTNGDVSEDDYDKRSIYSLLYALYRSMGDVKDEHGERYEFTFNTWGYAWPEAWGPCPHGARDPQRYGKNAYAGLYQAPAVKDYIKSKDGKVHVIEMGCGTGAGAHHVLSTVLPNGTYEAVDMQFAGISTAKRKFVPELNGRLKATWSDATQLTLPDNNADFVAVNETHVTEMVGKVTDEDRAFFQTAKRLIKPGGFLVWGNAIPTPTWQPCFDYLESIGMKMVEHRDVTKEAVVARNEDKPRIDAYWDQCVDTFHAFKIPVLGAKRKELAEWALKNFARNPGTKLFDNMVDGSDQYKVLAFQKS